MNINKIDYFFELYEKSSIPSIFQEVRTKPEGEIIENPRKEERVVENMNTINSVFFIPDYLYPQVDTGVYKVKKVEQFFKGYAIFLDGFATVDAYLKSRFRSNAKAIRRRIRRLETSFSISQKMYFGGISKEEYDVLMDHLHDMLVKRFEQRNDVSQTLIRWDYYRDMYFSLINEGKASLFVIQERSNPIVISLGHHFENRLFSAISSYDIDFGKFSLGSVEIYKKLEWCLANNHVSYEMGMGDLSYKREWCNHIYNFEHQIIYPKNSTIAKIKSTVELSKVSLKEFVFKIAYVHYKNYKAKIKKEMPVTKHYTFSDIQDVKDIENLETIDYNSPEFSFLRSMVFDFLYASQEKLADVAVHKADKNKTSFFIAGKNKMQLVTEEPHKE